LPPAPPPPVALAVVGAEVLPFVGPELEVNVTFNTSGSDPINDPFAADPNKWTARYLGQKYVGSLIAQVDFETLYLQLSPAGAEVGPDVISYSNAPSDVSDSLGRQLAAFEGFAL
jgi:hypothetical protein